MVRAAWLIPSGQTREDTRLAPLGTFTPDGPLGTRPGVLAGGDPFAATGAAAMDVQIGTGRAVVQGTVAQGAYPLVLDAPVVRTIADGDAQYDRIDSVVLRVYDGLYDTSGQTAADVEIVPGTASDSPVPPALPSPSCLRLWDVRVPAGASAGVGGISWASALSDRRSYTAAHGGIIPRGTTADPGPYDGAYADHDGTLMRWDADTGAWQTYRAPAEPVEVRTSGLSVASGWTLNSGGFEARRSGPAASWTVYVQRTGADFPSAAGADENLTDTRIATLPAGWGPAIDTECLASDGFQDGSAYVDTAGVVTLRTWPQGHAIDTGNNLRISAAYIQ